jgi:biofilm PGA synthesis protein PgaD
MKFDPESLIINRPDLVPSTQKWTAWGITLFFWGALAYLWQPLLSLIAWGFNIRLFYNHMILLGGYHTFLQLVWFYLKVIAVLGGGLILWARINQWRFRGKERRQSLGDTDIHRLLTTYGVSSVELNAASQSRIVTVGFATNGQLAFGRMDHAETTTETMAEPSEETMKATINSVADTSPLLDGNHLPDTGKL